MAGTAYLLKIVVNDLLPALMRSHRSTNGDPRSAGQQSPEYWHAEQRKAVADVIGPIMERFTDQTREQTNVLRMLSEELREYIAMERGRRERRKPQ